MSDTVVDQLRSSLGSFPATERRVAMHLLSDYPMAGLSSASERARVVGVSAPTVLRLAARLGYGSYAEFQSQLRDELAAQLSSPLNKAPVEAEARAPADSWRAFGLGFSKEVGTLLKAPKKSPVTGDRSTYVDPKYQKSD